MNNETNETVVDAEDEFGPKHIETQVAKKIKKLPKGGIGALTVDLLRGQSDTDERIISIVCSEYPDSKFKQTHVSYYRSILKSLGELCPAVK